MAFVAAVIAWFIVATLGNLVIRQIVEGYATQEAAMSFTWPAQVARLLLGIVATAASAFVAMRLSAGRFAVAAAVGLALLALFVPVHVNLWNKFPVWYHLVFLLSLPLVSMTMGALLRKRPA